jgi:hypothetical protein
MKRITGLGYLATVALVTVAMAFSPSPASAGKGYGRDNNPGKANGHAAEGGPSSNGAQASARGALNAAHASGEAFIQANANSRVGMLAEYMDAMLVYEAAYDEMLTDPDYIDAMAILDDPEATDEEKEAPQAVIDGFMSDLDLLAAEAGEELKEAANKEDLIDIEVVHSVNDLLDGKYKSFTDDGAVHEPGEQDLIDNLSTD